MVVVCGAVSTQMKKMNVPSTVPQPQTSPTPQAGVNPELSGPTRISHSLGSLKEGCPIFKTNILKPPESRRAAA